MSPDAAGPGDRAHIYFNDADVLSLGDKDGNRMIRARSLPLVKRLNRLYRADHLPHWEVTPTGARSARILADGQPIIDVLPEDITVRPDAMATAQDWIGAIERALEAKKGARR